MVRPHSRQGNVAASIHLGGPDVSDDDVFSDDSFTPIANAHWGYVKTVLTLHGVEEPELGRISYHYRSAFDHGIKHAKQSEEEMRRGCE